MVTEKQEEVSEEQIKEKYMQFQFLQKNIEQLSSHLEMLNQQNAELEISIHALQELGKSKVGDEILAPIADGIFLRAELKENQKFIVNVGSGITVEKTKEQVIELLETQKKEISEKIIEAEAILQELNAQALKIYQEVEEHVN